MFAVFRVDASLQMGTGHVMRCLTLANALKQSGIECEFICRDHPGNLISYIAKHGYKTHTLPSNDANIYKHEEDLPKHSHWLGSDWQSDAELTSEVLSDKCPGWLVVDHYALDDRWESFLRNKCNKLMVIDDLADRKHNCDIVLDQSYCRDSTDYNLLVPKQAVLLMGTKYALLRPEFADWRNYSLKRREKTKLKNILISLGGADPDNITGKVLDVLSDINISDKLNFTVVLGATSPHVNFIKRQVNEMSLNANILTNVDNMAELMANSDLAIGAGGTTTWERCCLGLPTIMFVTAENQKVASKAIKDNNIAWVYEIDKLDVAIKSKLSEIIQFSEILHKMTEASQKIVDGLGCDRVIKHMTFPSVL